MDNDKNNEVKWYRKKWFMWLMLICCWPIGLVFLYMHRSEYTRKKLLQIAVLTFFVVVCTQAWSKLNQPETQKQSVPVQTKQTEQAQQTKSDANKVTNGTLPSNKATTNSTSTQKAAPVVRGGTTGPNGETIKGNINKKGEKIYHMPGSASYNRTIPEAWFSTPEEAEAAGYRAAKR